MELKDWKNLIKELRKRTGKSIWTLAYEIADKVPTDVRRLSPSTLEGCEWIGAFNRGGKS